MKRILQLFVFTALLLGSQVFGQIPEVPNPPRLVNDFAGILSSQEIDELENRLVAFNDSTSNVICIVTVNDLGDYTAGEFAGEIGNKWGVNDKKYQNGIVILIKPRNETGGDVYIAVGYDLEAVVPDAIAKRIVEYEMIPALKEGKYYESIDKALNTLMPIVSGEISAARYQGNPGWVILFIFGIILFVVILMLLIFRNKWKNNRDDSDNQQNGKDTFWKALWIAMLAANSRNSRGNFGGGNSWGGFGGRGGFGGGSGGFGGFGGFGSFV